MGKYVNSTLMAGEKINYEAKLHWKIFISLKAFFTLWLSPIIQRATTEIAVTNKRLVIKKGLISRQTFEMNLNKVESLSVDQGLFGRMLNYGNIIVRGSGASTFNVSGVAKPLELRKRFNEALDAYMHQA